jgi:hypothetical protein
MITSSARNRWNIYIILFLYKITLDLVFIFVVAPNYSYVGYSLHFSAYKYIISVILLALMFQPIAGLLSKISPSSLIILILNLAYFIPGCTLYAWHGLPDNFFVFYAVYWILLMFLHYFFPHLRVPFVTQRMTRGLFIIIIIFISLAGILISGVYNGFRLHFGLMDVYHLRTIQKEMKLPTLVRYLQPLASIFLPIAIVYLLTKKEFVWGVALSIIQMLLFALGGHKTTIFALFVAIFIYLFYKEKRSIWILWIVLFLNITALLEAMLSHGFSYTGIFFQYRTFFMPSMISSNFFDFFSTHEHVYLRDSILRWIGFHNPYGMPIPNLISGVYSGNYSTLANNGMCGDAFYQFGWTGLVIYPFLITLAIRLFEACSRYLDIRIVITACILFSQAFINSPFFIVMLTNGFIFTSIFLYFMPRSINTGNGSVSVNL